MRNIGPAWGEAGAPTIVRTSVTRPAAGARSEIGAEGFGAPAGPPGSCGGGLKRAGSWPSVTRSPSRTKRSVTLEPSWSAPTTASRRGTRCPGHAHLIGEAAIGRFGHHHQRFARLFRLDRARAMVEPIVDPDQHSKQHHAACGLQILG